MNNPVLQPLITFCFALGGFTIGFLGATWWKGAKEPTPHPDSVNNAAPFDSAEPRIGGMTFEEYKTARPDLYTVHTAATKCGDVRVNFASSIPMLTHDMTPEEQNAALNYFLKPLEKPKTEPGT